MLDVDVLGGVLARAGEGFYAADGEAGLGPVYEAVSIRQYGDGYGGVGGVGLTPINSRLSSFCRGITVTISISHKKATSDGVRPGGRGNAMVDWRIEGMELIRRGE